MTKVVSETQITGGSVPFHRAIVAHSQIQVDVFSHTLSDQKLITFAAILKRKTVHGTMIFGPVLTVKPVFLLRNLQCQSIHFLEIPNGI